MRLRNVKNKQEIMDKATNLILNPKEYKGKWNTLFNNDNPIYIEIGMGKGDFIIEHAKRYKDINFIGIEKFDSVIVRAIEKVPEDLNNLKLIRMDAKEIDEVFDKEIDRIFLNFSDPWPKKRHHDRRLTSHLFLKRYDNLFKKEKEIIQKTDNRDLFEYSVISLTTYGYKIEDISLDLHNSDYEDIITTEYEKRFVALGNNIYYLVAKNSD
ncbi:MAG: tRNA (guanosine(46)-N7)-methyltransferase TrmB [Bacilli bacterium]|nr:tRNA (guanosine(46)-N7)-methyltransferase TrmB [Bacilli bacterium]